MSFFQVVLLAVAQGLTEFLPVSSSGHLVLLQNFFGLPQPPVLLDATLHLGTLLAVLVYFRRKIFRLTMETVQTLVDRDSKKMPRLVWAVILGTVPAAFFGVWLNDFLEAIFSSTLLLSFSFIITSLFLFALRFAKVKESNSGRIGLSQAIKIGFFQSLALLPGVSRSGVTIVSARFLGVARDQAFEFSFLLSIPAILGAMFLQLASVQTTLSSALPLSYFEGALLAGGVGFISLKLLHRSVVSDQLYLYGFYTFGLAILSLLVTFL